MQLFFFDTETSGFMQNGWRIIQFGAIYWFYDKETDKFYPERIINQYINIDSEIDGWAFKVHWISKDQIKPFKKIGAYIKEFLAYIAKSDYVICHNVDFDVPFLKKECDIVWVNFDRNTVKTVCTMKNRAVQEYMWEDKRPKLSDLHQKLFNRSFDNAHNAMADIEATKDCFLELYKKDIIILI